MTQTLRAKRQEMMDAWARARPAAKVADTAAASLAPSAARPASLPPCAGSSLALKVCTGAAGGEFL